MTRQPPWNRPGPRLPIGKAQVDAARINLGYTRVTAPISGRIGKSSVTDGALVTAYQPSVSGHHSTAQPHLRGCHPIVCRAAAFETPPGNRQAQQHWRQRQKSPHPPGRRHPLSPGRHLAIPGHHRGPGYRVFRPADRGPQSQLSALAGHVCPGRGPGGYCGAGHLGRPSKG